MGYGRESARPDQHVIHLLEPLPGQFQLALSESAQLGPPGSDMSYDVAGLGLGGEKKGKRKMYMYVGIAVIVVVVVLVAVWWAYFRPM